MGSVPDFNVFLLVMFWSALSIFVLAMLLMVLLLTVRFRAIARRRHVDSLITRWRRIFTGALPVAEAKLHPRDVFTVLNLWNDFQRVKMTGEGIPEDALDAVARAAGLDGLAIVLLRRGDDGDRIVALTSIGYLRLHEALPLIEPLTTDEFGEVALAAFRALVLIEPIRVKEFIFAIARRDDLRLRTIDQILRELGPGRISRALAIAAEDTTDEQVLRLLRFFTLCDPPVARAVLRDQLGFRADPNILAAALRSLTPFVLPDDREYVAPFLRHPASFVRIAAIGAIARIGNAEDRAVLIGLLSDDNSWVRYRAAQTLLDRFSSDEQAGDLRRDVADRYAQDALTQVLAERSVVALQQFISDEIPSDVTDRRHAAGSGEVSRRPINALRARV